MLRLQLRMIREERLTMASLCQCEADEVSRSNLGGDRGLPRFARNDKREGLRMTRGEGPAMAGKTVSEFIRVTIDCDAHSGRCSL